MTSELHPKAEAELKEASDWYAGHSLVVAGNFVTAIESAIAAVLRDPGRFEPAGSGVRICRLKRFPYKLCFEFDELRHHVRILCIMHNKRKPDYWRDRVIDEF